MLDIITKVASTINPIFGALNPVIESLGLSSEKSQELKIKIAETQNQLQTKMLDYEAKIIEQQASVIKSEATGESWLQRNWRPITMMVMLIIIVSDMFGLTTKELPDSAWELLKLGISGYIVSRGAEKCLKTYKGVK